MKKYNVILLLIDGARIDRLFQFPIFKKLKEEGCFFSEMIASAPYTLVAMNSIFTGMYGSKNGIDAYHKIFQDPKAGCKTLAEYLTENGWYTRGDAMRLSLVSNKGFAKLTSQEDDPDPDFIKIHKKILEEKFKSLGIVNNKVVFTCGSSVTASVLGVAYSLINNTYMPTIYVGSWSEYGKK